MTQVASLPIAAFLDKLPAEIPIKLTAHRVSAVLLATAPPGEHDPPAGPSKPEVSIVYQLDLGQGYPADQRYLVAEVRVAADDAVAFGAPKLVGLMADAIKRDVHDLLADQMAAQRARRESAEKHRRAFEGQ